MSQSQNRKIPLDFNLHRGSEEDLKKLLIRARKVLSSNQSYRVLFLEADKPRSMAQSKYYWMIINKFCKDTHATAGHDPKEFHEEMKKKFAFQIAEINGSVYETEGSTSTMNTKEFSEFVENVRKFLLEFFDYETPNPNEIPIEDYASQIVNRRGGSSF